MGLRRKRKGPQGKVKRGGKPKPKTRRGRICWLEKHPNRRAALIAHVHGGVLEPAACRLVGLARQRYSEWLVRGREDLENDVESIYRQFLEDVEYALAAGFDEIHQVVRNGITGWTEIHREYAPAAAKVGEEEYEGEERAVKMVLVGVKEIVKCDPGLGLKYMERSDPKNWGLKQEIKHEATIAHKRIVLDGPDPSSVLPATSLRPPVDEEEEA